MLQFRRFCVIALAIFTLSSCSAPIYSDSDAVKAQKKSQPRAATGALNSSKFTLAVIPDTQNYVDYTHQTAAGFGFDASDLFIQQMQYIADNSISNGGNIAFVASVGDVWQHQTKKSDPEHEARGVFSTPNPIVEQMVKVTPETLTVEIPKAIEGYKILSDADVPFGVAPGNHDYDSMWTAAKFPPNLSKPMSELTMTPEDIGVLHVGGLDNFRSVFGDDKPFYKDKPWYVDSYNGGANSAQKFTAGGYTFLHITLEMQAGNDVIDWAKSVMAKHPGLPTIFTTHDYLSVDARRWGNPILNFATADPGHHNDAQQMWDKLYGQHAQIFMVLCGHQHGQSHRIDLNVSGGLVYQVLADYQDRAQVSIDSNQADNQVTRKPEKIGDGWFRLMQFDLNQQKPKITVKTYSTHYKSFSGEQKNYAAWYKEHEQPKLSDEDFLKTDDFVLDLTDFHARFSRTRTLGH